MIYKVEYDLDTNSYRYYSVSGEIMYSSEFMSLEEATHLYLYLNRDRF